MAVTATVQGFNVGADVSFAIMDQYGDVFSEDMMGLMTQFDLRSVDTKMKVSPINNGGVPVLQTIPNGLRGQMSFVRDLAHPSTSCIWILRTAGGTQAPSASSMSR